MNDKGNTSLKPSLFHSESKTDGKKAGRSDPSRVYKPNIAEEPLRENFRKLKEAEVQLRYEYAASGHEGKKLMDRYRILRWAILQHYKVCGTPLLDVTQSLRVAASFASLENDSATGYVHVLGVPNLSGTLTASAEAGLQVIRLSGICPSSARRPHVQQGYLLGEYPEMGDWDQKAHYPQHEIDPARRLVAKFKLDPSTFWNDASEFPRIKKTGLYQSKNDTLYDLTRPIERALNPH